MTVVKVMIAKMTKHSTSNEVLGIRPYIRYTHTYTHGRDGGGAVCSGVKGVGSMGREWRDEGR